MGLRFFFVFFWCVRVQIKILRALLQKSSNFYHSKITIVHIVSIGGALAFDFGICLVLFQYRRQGSARSTRVAEHYCCYAHTRIRTGPDCANTRTS